MPLTMPEPRYFSIPSAVVGGAARRKAALNWRPCVRSLTQVPLAWTNSPAGIAAAAARVPRGDGHGTVERPHDALLLEDHPPAQQVADELVQRQRRLERPGD